MRTDCMEMGGNGNLKFHSW